MCRDRNLLFPPFLNSEHLNFGCSLLQRRQKCKLLHLSRMHILKQLSLGRQGFLTVSILCFHVCPRQLTAVIYSHVRWLRVLWSSHESIWDFFVAALRCLLPQVSPLHCNELPSHLVWTMQHTPIKSSRMIILYSIVNK